MNLGLRAEILLTRKCNLRCNYCDLVNTNKNELTLEQWKRGFELLFNVLDVKLLAILGGEPLVLGIDYLCELAEFLSGFKDRKFALVSNCVGLEDKDIDRLIKSGIKAWVTSVDAVDASGLHNAQRIKSQHGLNTLVRLSEKGVKHISGVVTVGKKNIKNVMPTVEMMINMGIMPNVEIVHYKRGPYNIFCAEKERLMGDLLDHSDFEDIQKLSTDLQKLSLQNKFFQVPEFYEMWSKPQYSIGLKWNCRHFSFVSVDSDGTMGVCDDFFPPGLSKINVLDLENVGRDNFEKLWLESCRSCPGCFMSSHVMSDLYVERKLSRRSSRIINSNLAEAKLADQFN